MQRFKIYLLTWQIGLKTVGIGPTQSWAPLFSFQSILAATHQLNSENQNCIVFAISCSIQLLVCFSHKMDIAQSKFMAKVEELFNNRDNADVTLYCEGESVMAHSSILEMRWDTGICSLTVQQCQNLNRHSFSQIWDVSACSTWQILFLEYIRQQMPPL